MSSSSPRRRSSRDETPWFQDGRTASEKQTTYFIKIRKLQEQLINREQHNLINAMERLKQITYPRKKPFVRQYDASIGGMSFPARPLNARRFQRPHKQEESELKPLRGKHLVTSKDVRKVHQESELDSFTMDELRQIYQMIPGNLNDNDIAKIVCSVNSTFPNEPSTYLLQPHLPSIPNPPRKANARLDNRLRLLSLASDPVYIECKPSMMKQLHTSHSQRGPPKTSEKNSENPNRTANDQKVKKKKKKTVLKFDIQPNDPTLFSHCADEERIQSESGATTPLPPPNSRPNTPRSAPMLPVQNAVTDIDIAKGKVNDKLQSDKKHAEPAQEEMKKAKQDQARLEKSDNKFEAKSEVEVNTPTVTIVRKPSDLDTTEQHTE